MLIQDLQNSYKSIYEKRSFVLFHAMFRYIFNRPFRTSVDVYNMIHTTNSFLKKRKKYRINRLYGCDVGMHASIQKGLILPHSFGVVIGNNVEIGEYCTIYQNVTLGKKNDFHPKIGNHVTIYASSIIIGNVKIGDWSIIGAGSIVLHDVLEGTVVAGNPAQILRRKNER